uniref:Uncharacterized protein n=1 Tax=Arundo donax TaxID=35708 RepID=A0A0A9EKX7_ARUDO
MTFNSVGHQPIHNLHVPIVAGYTVLLTVSLVITRGAMTKLYHH